MYIGIPGFLLKLGWIWPIAYYQLFTLESAQPDFILRFGHYKMAGMWRGYGGDQEPVRDIEGFEE